MHKLHLKPGREKSLKRHHPWIFAGAIARDGAQAIPSSEDAVAAYQRPMVVLTNSRTYGIGEILADRTDKIYLGNLDARRDWGFAPEYVEAMWRILQHDTADDFVIATGVQYSVRDFVDAAASELGMALQSRGEGVQEHALDAQGRRVVAVDPRYFRPTEVDLLQGDATKAKNMLGWCPRYTLNELAEEMVRRCRQYGVASIRHHGAKALRERGRGQ